MYVILQPDISATISDQGKIKATAWDVLEGGLDSAKVDAVLGSYRDGEWPKGQVHVHL